MGEQIGVARPEKTRQGLKLRFGRIPEIAARVARPEKTRQGLKHSKPSAEGSKIGCCKA